MDHSKIIVITGAAGGIGTCLTRALSEEYNARIWATDVDAIALKELKNQMQKYGHDIRTEVMDVTKLSSIESVITKIIAEDKSIDLWINNAGISSIKPFHEQTLAEFQRVIDINFNGTVNCSHLVLDRMREQGRGTIVNMASVAGFVPCAYMSSYVAAKHAVVGFTRALRSELKLHDSPVQTMLVAPGFVATKLIAKGEQRGFPEWLSWMLANPATIARAVVKGLKSQRAEIYPSWNGKFMLRMHKYFPEYTVNSAKILLSKSFKDVVLNRFDL